MTRPTIISALLCLSLAGCNVELVDAKQQAHRPADGFAAFAEACITPNGSREHAETVFAKHRVSKRIPRNRTGRLPGGYFGVKKDVEARYWPQLRQRFATTCEVRIQGLWADFANDAVTKRLTEQGFRKVGNIKPDELSYRYKQTDFILSATSGAYRHQRGKYVLIMTQSIQPGGHVTDLLIGLLE